MSLLPIWRRYKRPGLNVTGSRLSSTGFLVLRSNLGMDVANTFEIIDVVNSMAVQLSYNMEFSDGWGYVDMSGRTVTPTVFTAGDPSGVVQGLPLIGFIAVADTVTGTERGGVFPLRKMSDEQ
ncbi:MAG: hypothetical protein KME48_15740 [Candidatus Thiodiazotropha sp. (ex Ctena orbiculata)]|nr:hypothetical protein [Candidatus Thiodiazotropha taylori]MBT3036235.1 hypothetical protein [Candidatus Thiodiazotropha taylori]